MLIAMAVLCMTLSAVLLLSFGSQSLAIDSQNSATALAVADATLEDERILSVIDFAALVNTVATSTIGSVVYTKNIKTELQPDLVTKKVTIIVSWNGERSIQRKVSLTTLITNYENAVGASTCDSNPAGDWKNPQVQNPVQNFASLVQDTSGSYQITGVQAYFGKLFITATTNATTSKTFFIFSTTSPNGNPQLIGSLDTTGPTVSSGGAAVAVASSSAGVFAFVTNAYGANFNTCIAGSNCSQLQIINIVNPSQPILSYNLKLPSSVSGAHITGTGGQASGKVVFYKNGYLYIGLRKTATGPEFNIVDVHNPFAPVWVGGYAIGNDVNAIHITNKYAYIATPNAQNLLVLDISNPALPLLAGSFAGTGGANGARVSSVGNTVYLGRTFGTNEFYMLSAANPTTISTLGSIDLGVGSATSINGIVIRNTLAFLLTNTQLQVLNLSNPTAISKYNTSTLTLPGGSAGAALSCEGNTLYAASNASTTAYLSVINPTP
jgi:hypothetical protein